MTSSAVAMILDIVRSRELEDREVAQAAIREAFESATAGHPAVRPLWATFADEFQAVFTTVGDALRATSIVRTELPTEVDCRFGFGFGEVREIEPTNNGSIQDGSAWWRARSAIDEAHRREEKTNPSLRGWFVSDDEEPGSDAIVNGFLLLRDEVIGAMRPRERRLTAGVLLGRSQVDLADQEGITQSAVSQSLRKSGGATLLATHQLFDVEPGSIG